MDTQTILDIIDRRKTGRRVTDQNPLAVYWPTLAAVSVALVLFGFWLGKVT